MCVVGCVVGCDGKLRGALSVGVVLRGLRRQRCWGEDGRHCEEDARDARREPRSVAIHAVDELGAQKVAKAQRQGHLGFVCHLEEIVHIGPEQGHVSHLAYRALLLLAILTLLVLLLLLKARQTGQGALQFNRLRNEQVARRLGLTDDAGPQLALGLHAEWPTGHCVGRCIYARNRCCNARAGGASVGIALVIGLDLIAHYSPAFWSAPSSSWQRVHNIR